MVNGHCSREAAARAALLVNATAAVEEDEEANLVPLGIAVGLTASVFINIAQNQLARGKQPGLWVGVFALSAIANFGAFALAPGSVLSPLEGAQFVTNLIYNLANRNPALLHSGSGALTAYGRRVLLGTLLVLGGVVLPVVGGAGAAPAKFDEKAIECMWSRPLTIAYLGGCAALAAACLSGWRLMRTSEYVRSPAKRRFDQLVMQDIWRKFGCETAERVRAARDEVAAYRRYVRDTHMDPRPLSLALYGLGSALVGGLAVVMAKVVSELIEILLGDGPDILTRPLIWVQSALVAALFAAWLDLLGRAPTYFAQVAAIPTLQGGYIIFASVGPGIFLEELAQLSAANVALFFSGMALIAAGVALMLSAGKPTARYSAPTFWRGISTMTFDEKTKQWRVSNLYPDLPANLVRARQDATRDEDADAYLAASNLYDDFLARQLTASRENRIQQDPNAETILLEEKEVVNSFLAFQASLRRGPRVRGEAVPLLALEVPMRASGGGGH